MLGALTVTGSHPCSRKILWQACEECLKKEKVESKREVQRFQQGHPSSHRCWKKLNSCPSPTGPYTFHPPARILFVSQCLPCNHFGLLLCLNDVKFIPASGTLHLLVALPEGLWRQGHKATSGFHSQFSSNITSQRGLP